MKYQKLNQEMIRYYDNMKPRLTNPTYVSSNVGITLGTSMMRSQSMRNVQFRSKNSKFQEALQIKIQSKDEQNFNTFNYSGKHRRSQSNLLNYGMSSLSPIKKQINDKDIYEKQAKKYNIVTIQPKQYMDSINIFPKYRLQNSDQSYQKKLRAETNILGTRNSPNKRISITNLLDQKLNVNPEFSA